MDMQTFNMAQTQVVDAQAQAAINKANTTANAAKNAAPDKLRQAAEDFEAVFLSQMLQPMFETVPQDGPFSGGSSEKIYRSMMVEETGKAIAANGGIGIADNVYRELLKIQEQSYAP